MKKVFLFLLVLLFTTSLQSYSKKIIFASFSNQTNAKNSFNTFKKTSSYTELNKLAKENNFKIYVRQSKKYYIVVAEPIRLESTGIKAHKLVKQEYENVNLNTYLPPEIVTVKDIEPKNLTKDAIRVKAIKKQIEKKEEIKEKVVTIKTATPLSLSMDIWSILKYVLMVSFLSILIYYYIKLKRIYNQY